MSISEDYRSDDLRRALRLFSSREEEAWMFPEGVSYARMEDLEAGYELVMGAKPKRPDGYSPRRGPRAGG